MNTKDLELKRKRIETAVKILILLGVGFFVAPFIFIAIKGLIGLALAAVVALVGINVAPRLGMALANWKLKTIKAEAAKNPIETMEVEYQERVEKLHEFKEHIRVFFGSVKTFYGKLDGFKAEFPQDAKQFDDQYAAMMQLLDLRKAKYDEAKNNLVKFESVIRRAKAIWQMSQEAAKMRKSAGVDVDEFYSKLKTETALDSVTQNMNMAFADLELALMDEKESSSASQVQVVECVKAPSQIPEKTGPPTLDLDFEEDTKIFTPAK